MTEHGGVVAATIGIPPVGRHDRAAGSRAAARHRETRGLDVEAEAQRPGSGVWKAIGGFETQGAIDVTRQVAAELREARERGQ